MPDIGIKAVTNTSTLASESQTATSASGIVAAHVNLREASGAEIGTSTSPVAVSAGARTTAALTSAAIDFTATGDNTLVSATASQTTKVYKLFLIVGAATNLTFKNGASTSLTGAMSFGANGTMTIDFDGEPWFTTSTNTAFILNQSGTAQVSGRIYYIKN
jgi:hypothetical protein